jgi:filamentous hemagglutinin family protein
MIPVVLVASCLLAALAPRGASAQHITIDGRLSPAQTLVGPNYRIGANLGKQIGSNLFHSFGQFSLANTPVPESATFTSTGSTGPISNVIGRVTAGNQSSINGGIISAIPGANLYLINPSGIVFGPHATVNVSGSFHASTADYLRMSDGAKFQATNPDASTLSAAAPAAFGFLTGTPGQISVNGSTLGPVPGTLGLVGGPVSISGGTLSVPAGTIHVTSAAGTGEVPVDPRNTSALTVMSLGSVAVAGGSELDVSDPKGLGGDGSVFIRSGELMIDASEVNADNYGSGPGGKLVLRAKDQLTLSDGASVHSFAQANGSGAAVSLRSSTGGTLSVDNSMVAAGSNGAGNSGKLVVTGGQVSLTNGAQLTSNAQSTGNGGAIKIKAGNLVIDGSATNVTSTTAGSGLTDSASNPVRAGAGGAITITAGLLTIQNGASIGTSSVGDGPGGAVSVIIGGMLTIVDQGAITTESDGIGDGGPITIASSAMLVDGTVAQTPSNGFVTPTGIASLAFGSGKAGDVAAASGALSIRTNGAIGSVTFGSGDAGSVSVNVAGALTIDGRNANPSFFIGTGVSSLSLVDIGSGAQVDVEAGSVAIANGGVISASTFPGTSAPTVIHPLGNAGNVIVHTGALSITSNGEISAATSGQGSGGDILVTVSGDLIINGITNPFAGTGIFGTALPGGGAAGRITVSAKDVSIINSGMISASTFGNGAAGEISVKANALTVAGGAQIASTTAGPGKGGNVDVTIANAVTLTGTGPNGPSGITASALQGSAGQAGDVVLMAGGAIALSGGAKTSSSTAGVGDGGVVKVTAQGPLSLSDAGSGITASAASTAEGSAGSVTVSAPQITLMTGSEISSTTAGSGAGGPVVVITPGALVLDGQGVWELRSPPRPPALSPGLEVQ